MPRTEEPTVPETVAIRYIGRDSDGVILDEHSTELICLPGEAVDVDPELAERCLVQEENWELVGSAHKPPTRPVANPPEAPVAPVSPDTVVEATTAPEAPTAPDVKE